MTLIILFLTAIINLPKTFMNIIMDIIPQLDNRKPK